VTSSPDELWKEARKVRDRGDFAALKSILLSIRETHGHKVSYKVMLGLAHWELEELPEAEQLLWEPDTAAAGRRALLVVAVPRTARPGT